MQIYRIVAISIFVLVFIKAGISQSFDPEIIKVSVDTLIPNNQGRVKISWSKKQHPDVVGYKLYRIENDQGTYIELPPLFVDETSYVDELGTADIAYRGYSMASVTEDDEISQNLVDPHYTVFLQANTFDYCDKSIKITWTNYKGWGDNLCAYDIYRKNGTQPYQKIESIPAFGDTVFVEHNVDYNSIYKYYVVARHVNEFESLSNIVQIITETEQTVDLDDLYIDTVQYNGAEVKIGFHGVQTDQISAYNIYRKQGGNNYKLIDSIENTGSLRYQFTDDNPGSSGNFYRVGAFGLCNDSLGLSNTVRQVVLKGVREENVVRLTWNNGFTEIDESSRVFIQVDGGEFKELEQLGDENRVEYDLLEMGSSNSENFCFYIAAELPIGYYSISNAQCFTVEPVVNMPTAFTPNGDGLNDYVIPQIENADIDKFEFIVYDKYGGRIFETTMEDFKWDGRSAGKAVKEGAYLYYLEFTTRWGSSYEKSGVINVFYP